MDRLSYIDTAKFFGIFFVIIGHSCITGHLAELLYSFHVQLFFICYGFVYKSKYKTLRDVLLIGGGKNVQRILIPFALLCLILGPPLSLRMIAEILYGGGGVAEISGIRHLWFLPCFFLSIMIYNIIDVITRNNQALQMWVMILLGFLAELLCFDNTLCISLFNKTFYLTGYTFSYLPNEIYIGLPFSFNSALTGVILIYLGNLTSHIFQKYNLLANNIRCAGLIFFSLSFGIVFFIWNQSCLNESFKLPIVALSHAAYGNYLLFLSTSLMLTIFIVCFSKIVDNTVTAKYGKQTMTIYAFHPFILNVISVFGIPSFYGIIHAIITIIIICALLPMIRSIDPYLIGETSRSYSGILKFFKL